MLLVERLGAALHFDEGHQLLVDSDAVVSEVDLDLILSCKVLVLVVAKPFAKHVRNQEAGVAFVGVARDEVGKRLLELANGRLGAVSRA